MNQKLASYIVLIFVFFSYLQLYPFAVSYVTRDFFRTVVDWTNGNISITVKEKLSRVVVDPNDRDYGKEYTAYNISDARSKSIIAAREKASLRLVRAVESLRLDDQHTILSKLDLDEAFREKFNRFYLLEPQNLNIRYKGEEVILESRIAMLGAKGIMNFLDIPFGSESFPEFDMKEYPVRYTGLIVDARHLSGAKPALLPKIVTDAGLEFFSAYYVNRSYAIDKGLVAYAKDPVLAMKDKRVGSNPFFVVALDTVGENKTGYSISTDDVRKLLAAKQSRNSLKMCRVIILLSQQPF
ncbi:MAG: hypothetical protein AAF518_15490 [Spirochaetota bacterium]